MFIGMNRMNKVRGEKKNWQLCGIHRLRLSFIFFSFFLQTAIMNLPVPLKAEIDTWKAVHISKTNKRGRLYKNFSEAGNIPTIPFSPFVCPPHYHLFRLQILPRKLISVGAEIIF